MSRLDFYLRTQDETLAAVAKRAGISTAALYRVRHGIGEVSGRRLRSLARLIGCRPDEVLEVLDATTILAAIQT